MDDQREVLEQRLLANRRIDENGCWLWTGSTAKGYGWTYVVERDKRIATHRLAAAIWLDFDLDSPLFVLHRCDVPACFRPDHLFIGTQRDNVRDMVEKGRDRPSRGSKNPKAKLTEDQVRRIRDRVAAGETRWHVAQAFEVSHTIVNYIVRRKMWAHVD